MAFTIEPPFGGSEPLAKVIMNARPFALPMGTVTFLLTDIEKSTLAWQASPDGMANAVARHYEILDDAVAAHGGVRPAEQGEGDSIVAAFARASDAILAAGRAQRAFGAEVWPLPNPLKVRMAVHTGEAQLRGDENYVGQAIIRTARLRAIGHGGQVLVSQAARDLAIDQLGPAATFVDLGEHRLKDLARPEHVWQLAGDGLDPSFPPLLSLDMVRNNLPASLSTFIGRSDDVVAVARMVLEHRLVTVTGPGGIGKTRLALQVAAETADRFPGGLWWVELSPVGADRAVTCVAETLGVIDTASGDTVDHLAGRLVDTCLLLLDNCEHVLDAISPLVHELLRRCPSLTILATTRAALELPGEITWRVPPMAVPDHMASARAPQSLSAFDAVHLFLERARAVRPSFRLDDQTGAAVAEICQRLDGIPLAIELAAARCRSSSPRDILLGLGDALRMLTGATRVVMPRQQTLEASIAWSYALLPELQQVALRRLSVFPDGWRLAAAEAVLADGRIGSYDVLDLLDRLVQQSLVVVEERRGESRFRLLETVRQFAGQRLREAGEERQLLDRFVMWVEDFLAEITPGMFDERQIQVFDAFEDELLTVLAGLQLVLDEPDGLRRLCGLCVPLVNAGLTRDVAAPLFTAIDLATRDVSALDTSDRGRALFLRGGLGSSVGRFAEAAEELSRALTFLPESAALERSCALVMLCIGGLVRGVGDDGLIVQLLEQLEGSEEQYFREQSAKMRFIECLLRGSAAEAVPFHTSAAQLAAEPSSPEGYGEYLKWTSVLRWLQGQVSEALSLMDQSYLILRPTYSGARLYMSHRIAARICLAGGTEHPMLGDVTERLARSRSGDRKSVVYLTDAVGIVHHLRGELHEARAVLEPFLTSCLEQGLLILAVDVAMSLLPVLDALDDIDAVDKLIPIVRDLATSAPYAPGTALADVAEARLAVRRGDLVQAESLLHHALLTLEACGAFVHLPLVLEQLASVAVRQGNHDRAGRLAAGAQRLRDDGGIAGRPEPYGSEHRTMIAAVEAALGPASTGSHRLDVAELSMAELLAFAQRARGERRRPAFGWEALTPTEYQVVELVAEGLTNAAVAQRLLMGAETVKTHLGHAYDKLGVRRRGQLARIFHQRSAG